MWVMYQINLRLLNFEVKERGCSIDNTYFDLVVSMPTGQFFVFKWNLITLKTEERPFLHFEDRKVGGWDNRNISP